MNNIQFIGVPCYTSGRQGTPIDRIVIHWMAGTLASTDQTNISGVRGTSEHYGIEDGVIHQYVDEGDTAYANGDWGMNLRAISIEHSAQPGRNASEATLNTSAALIADICSRHGIPMDREHIIGHDQVVPTDCPGTIDINNLIARAKQANGQCPIPEQVPVSTSAVKYPINQWSGQVIINSETLIVRAEPTTNSAGSQGNTADGNVHVGDVIDVAGWLHAQDPYGDGRDIWLQTTNGHYVWAYGTNFSQGTKAAAVQQGGWVTITCPTLLVRTGPSRDYPAGAANTADGALHNGDSVQYVAAVHGENVDGNDIWLQSVRGNFFHSSGTNFN